MNEEVAITRVFERHACIYVEGVVQSGRVWLKAAFTVPKSEIIHMNRDAFEVFAKRQLPTVTEDKPWEADM